jgi:hypothetical protein
MKGGSDVICNLANHATIASATSFAFIGSYGRITSVAYNEANAMMYDVSVKFGASGSSAMLAVRT